MAVPFSVRVRQELCLLGMIGSLDPPRQGVREAIERCRDAGIRVIMITGDQRPTAVAIANEIGLLTSPETAEEKSIQCSGLHVGDDPMQDHLPEEDLDEIVARYGHSDCCCVESRWFVDLYQGPFVCCKAHNTSGLVGFCRPRGHHTVAT